MPTYTANKGHTHGTIFHRCKEFECAIQLRDDEYLLDTHIFVIRLHNQITKFKEIRGNQVEVNY